MRHLFSLLVCTLSLIAIPASAAPVTAVARPFAEDYMEYLDRCRTEVEATDFAIDAARAAGYVDLATVDGPLQPGDKVYRVNHDRAIILAVIGSNPVADGVNLIGSHIDAPRLDLKARPVYNAHGFYLLQTFTYGGIKRYQWVNQPLQLHGLWYDSKGTRHHVIIGDDPGEPTILIPDLEPHLSKEISGRTAGEAIGAEEIDPIIAMVSDPAPDWNDLDAAEGPEIPKDELLAMLRPYLGGKDLDATDLATGEFHLTPANEPRYAGLDKSMVAGYGQDDRANSFCAMRAILDMTGTPRYTAMAYLVGQEEIGSGNNTGAGSTFLNATIAKLMQGDPRSPEPYGDNALREALTNSWVLSADTPPAVNPVFPDVWESGNSLKLGKGIGVLKWGSGRDANPAYFAKIAALFDEADVRWQVAPLGKNAAGGGGTIGGFMSQEGMEVIDVGVTLLSMHSPYEVSSVNDLWEGYKAYGAFFVTDREF